MLHACLQCKIRLAKLANSSSYVLSCKALTISLRSLFTLNKSLYIIEFSWELTKIKAVIGWCESWDSHPT